MTGRYAHWLAVTALTACSTIAALSSGAAAQPSQGLGEMAPAAFNLVTRSTHYTPNPEPVKILSSGTCGTGETLIGGGAVVIPQQAAQLTGVRILNKLFTGPRVRARATAPESGFTGDWTMTVWALCATTSALSGVEYLSASSATSSASTQTAQVTCSSGKRLLSVGGWVNNGEDQVALTSLQPQPNLTFATVQAREDLTGYAGQWSVTGYGVCANTLLGQELVTAFANPPAALTQATCPGTKRALGVGGGTGLIGNGVFLAGIYRGGWWGAAYAATEAAGYPYPSGPTAYLICVP